MGEITIDLVIEPGTPFEFFEMAEEYAAAIRFYFEPVKDYILAFEGHITLKQRKDGNFSIQAHCNDRVTLDKMEEIIFDLQRRF